MAALGLLLLLGIVSGPRAANAKKGLRHHPNCAARKLCNRPLDQRDAAVNAIPPKDAGRAPKGHLKPLGHPDFADSWAGEIDSVSDMDPATFWSKYWPKKPFLLKGFAKRSPAYEKWKSDAYLIEKFGRFVAKCEPRNEDRLTDYCNMEKNGEKVRCGKDIIPYTETHLKLNKFWKRYENNTFDKYVVTQMPDVMGDDFIVPNFHSCAKRDPDDPGPEGVGRWATQMYENNFWHSYNAGQNFSTSVIHYDMNHQIMCLFDGVKQWTMWDLSSEIDKIPMWSNYYDKKRHDAQGSDDSPIDGERVDLLRWPSFKDAKWMNATMEAGDCLYTPALLLHYVRSYGRNVAGMTMWQRHEQYDPSCNGDTVGEPQLLSKYDVMWSYPEEDRSLLGWNIIKMGFPNWKSQVLGRLAAQVRRLPDKKMKQTEFVSFIMGIDKSSPRNTLQKRAGRVFAATDANSDGALEPKELFRSRELRFLIKDVMVGAEGRGSQEEDVEVDRFDLQGNTVKRKLEL